MTNISPKPTTPLMPKYLVTLTPLDTFFFGGETTFGQNEGANYFAKSNLFPQQTTILGALRYELLRQNGLLLVKDSKQEEKIKLIGEESFDVNKDNTFGIIEKISPIFMHYDGKNYFMRSKEFVVEKITEKETKTVPLTLTFLDGTHQLNGIVQSAKIPLLKKGKDAFNPKEAFAEQLVQGNEIENIDDIFKSIQKIGITKYKDGIPKPQNGKAPDNSLGFYKQTSYRLEKGWAFAFYLELTETKLKGGIIKMGGENRPFAMQLTTVAQSIIHYKDTATPEFNGTKIILLSDAFVEADIYQYCAFAITDIKTFRNIKTSLSTTTKWSDLGDNRDQPSKTPEKWQILERGSVLFAKNDNIEALKTALNVPHYQKIGYNIFQTI